jgi:multicomponent Na+:H+ antiporter subunit E
LVRAISLSGILFATWLLLSGHTEPFLIFAGAGSSIVCVAIIRRMDNIDFEGIRISISPRIVRYWLWLTREIIISNVDVARCVLSPDLPISPTLLRVRANQKTPLYQTMFANSITLTPGTVTIDLEDGVLLVHALNKEAADKLLGGEMDVRVAKVER